MMKVNSVCNFVYVKYFMLILITRFSRMVYWRLRLLIFCELMYKASLNKKTGRPVVLYEI